MKRRMFVILALAALILALACGAALADESGSCGDNVTYSFNSATGMLTISGTGAMADYDMSGNLSPFARNAEIRTVNVNEGVTAIGYAAFYGCSGITEVSLPENVSVIKGHAFRNCSGLDHITLPNGLESIGTGAFSFCRGLTGVTLPDGLTVINNGAFINCTNLTTVSIPGSVVSVGGNAFLGCTSLAGATFHNPDTIIDTDAFTGANGNLTLYGWNPSTAKDYADAHSDAVSFESLGSLTGSCGDNVTWAFNPATGALAISGTGYIANYASATAVPWYGFRSNIHSVSIANGVTEIGNRAFYGCTSLTNVTIPNSVTRIGWSAFMNCIGLTSVTILNPDCVIGDSDYDVFKNCASGFTLRGYSGSTAEAYAANTVNPCAFESLDSQSIQTGSCGDNVTWTLDPNTGLLTISGTGATYDYNYQYNPSPFGEKTNITSAVFSTGITRVGSWLLNDCVNLTSVSIPATVETIGEGAFYACGLTELTIPEGVTVLEKWAFNSNTQLSTLLLPDTLTTIGVAPFAHCSSLANVTIPASVTSIGGGAFYGCTSLTSVTILNPICVIGDSYYDVFYCCSSGMVLRGLTNSTAYLYAQAVGITFESLGTYIGVLTGSCGENLTYSLDMGIGMLTITGTGEMANYSSSANVPWYGYRSGITSVSIGSSVTSICECAFYYCTGLTGITIPDSVTSIGSGAFWGCSSLTSATIPSSVTSIGNATFADCTGLTSVTIPDSVTSIGRCAFDGCTGLTSVTIPDSITDIGYYTFADCTGLTSVTIPDSVTSIGRSAFWGCTGLTSITIPGSVTRIYVLAFEDCANLADVTILNPTCVIGDSDYDVFENCASGFTLRGYSGSTAETYANAAGVDFEPIPTAAFVLPAALTTIESEAFSGIAAEAVLIPASVISISGNPFAGSSVHYIYGSTDLVRNFAQAYGYVFVPIGD